MSAFFALTFLVSMIRSTSLTIRGFAASICRIWNTFSPSLTLPTTHRFICFPTCSITPSRARVRLSFIFRAASGAAWLRDLSFSLRWRLPETELLQSLRRSCSLFILRTWKRSRGLPVARIWLRRLSPYLRSLHIFDTVKEDQTRAGGTCVRLRYSCLQWRESFQSRLFRPCFWHTIFLWRNGRWPVRYWIKYHLSSPLQCSHS